MDFLDQIGAEAYVSVNVGSGTPREAPNGSDTYDQHSRPRWPRSALPTAIPLPTRVGFLGIGNESWDCGGNMTPEYYLSQLKIYSRFVRNFNPAQQDKQQMLKIAVGPGGADPSGRNGRKPS